MAIVILNSFLVNGAMINWELISLNSISEIWQKKREFLKMIFFCFFIITLIKIKSRRHAVSTWKDLNVFNTQIWFGTKIFKIVDAAPRNISIKSFYSDSSISNVTKPIVMQNLKRSYIWTAIVITLWNNNLLYKISTFVS